MSNCPIWLLDVDGVINAFPYTPAEKAVWPRWRSFRATPDRAYTPYADNAPANGYHITVAPDLIDAIRELHESGDVEVRWLTTWGSGANGELRRQLNFPRFDVAAEFGGSYSFIDWWKLPAAMRTRELEPDRPLIWTDDHIVHVPEAVDWIGEQDEATTLAIAPTESVGLTPNALALIREFVQLHKEAAA